MTHSNQNLAVSLIFALAQARALPEYQRATSEAPEPEPLETDNDHAIVSFKEEDGRTMRVVHTPGAPGSLSKYHLPRKAEPQPEATS